MKLKKGTDSRKCFDRALQSLPVTQHSKIWNLYIHRSNYCGVKETTVRVFRRYMLYNSSHKEDLVTNLEDNQQYEEAVFRLAI